MRLPKKELTSACFWAAVAYAMWRAQWPVVLALLVLAAAVEFRNFVELRREKIHDTDRQNLAALVKRMDETQAKLNSVHAQVFKGRLLHNDL